MYEGFHSKIWPGEQKVELFQGSTRTCKDSLALLKEELIVVRKISCRVVVCSAFSSISEALVEIPAGKEMLCLVWFGLFFWLTKSVLESDRVSS